MVDVLGLAAAAWGAVMAVAPVLQIRTMIRRRSADDVSIGYFLVLLPGFCLWLAYGSVSGNPYLVVPNTAAVVSTVVTVAIATALRARAGGRATALPDTAADDRRQIDDQRGEIIDKSTIK